MDKSSIIIMDGGGLCWVQTKDDAGRSRSSFLGNVGRREIVESWCLGKGIEFRQVEAMPARSAVRVSRPVSKSAERDPIRSEQLALGRV
jgi:hypothetical protein